MASKAITEAISDAGRRLEVLPAPARLEPGLRAYAVGDIHGCDHLVASLLDAIAEDAARPLDGCPPPERRLLVFLGDYVDRGPDPAGVIERLSAGGFDTLGPGFETVFLRGNHEAMMIAFLDGDTHLLDNWRANGADAVLACYGVEPPRFLRSAERVRADLAEALPGHHRAFLTSLHLTHRAGGYVFVHAGIQPGVPLMFQRTQDLLWIREPFLSGGLPRSADDEEVAPEAVAVHGHTIVRGPVVLPWRIGIDTGAFRTGRLTAAVLEADTVGFLATGV